MTLALVVALVSACASPPQVAIRTAPAVFGGTTSSEPQPYPTRVAAMYTQLYTDSEAPPLRELPAQVNVVNLAFAQGTPLTLVGDSPQGGSVLTRDLRALRERGVRVVLSVGGASGQVDTSDRAAFVRQVMAINTRFPLDGIDWDVEKSVVSVDDIVAISAELERLRGSDFAVTLTPNGNTINQYLPVAVALSAAGTLDMVAQQFYDAPVSTDAAQRRIRQLISAGVPENRIGIGTMVGSSSNYWTVDECVDNVRALKSAHPGLRGGFLWETSRAGTDEWASRVAPLLTGIPVAAGG